MLMVCKLNLKRITVNISLSNLMYRVCKLNFIKYITVNILLGNFKPFFDFLIFKLIIKPIRDFFYAGFNFACLCVRSFIKALGFINALLFFHEVIRFVLYHLICTLIFVTCFIIIIVYTGDDYYKYYLFIYGMLCVIGGLFCLFWYTIFFVCALDAYVEKDYKLFYIFIALSIITFLIGLAMIKYGLDLHLKQYLILIGSPPKSGSGSNGGGEGSGNNNGNGGTNTDGIGGGHRSDKDKEYKKRRLEYLESQETKYKLALKKASVEYKRVQKMKAYRAKKGKVDATLDPKMSTFKTIKEGCRFRLSATKAWIKAHKENKPYVWFNKKEFIINKKSPFALKVSPLEKKPETPKDG